MRHYIFKIRDTSGNFFVTLIEARGQCPIPWIGAKTCRLNNLITRD